jgi:hypothetical protein
VKPKSWKLGCTYNGCSVDIILALFPSQVVRKTIFAAPEGERVDTAQNVKALSRPRGEETSVKVVPWPDGNGRR